ncbi:hypothetical protein [uncultured Tessaracoccus sp.]|uniref:hypothetical protein n=1 Tax=uncultured Tessaracoccus sp. TaxID=905023 RepID=UPI002632B499|nr:hypothetical protein [uncultured Tessaracoccus sp.]
MEWLWLVGAVVLGLALLCVATVTDRRELRRAQREAVVVPPRGNDTVDAHVPTYITQAEIDALPDIEGQRESPVGQRFDARVAHRTLLPARGRAHLDSPRVLVVDGPITSIRQLLPALAASNPLAIIADTVHDEVARTVQANRKYSAMPLLVLTAAAKERARIAKHVHAQPLTDDDLRAGYVPDEAYGGAASLDADAHHVWIDVG